MTPSPLFWRLFAFSLTGPAVPDDFLTAAEAARRLGVSRPTFYNWLALSDYGLLVIRGRCVTVDYYQAGRQGHGKILIAPSEVERLKELMRVQPTVVRERREPVPRATFQHITVPLGHPDRRA